MEEKEFSKKLCLNPNLYETFPINDLPYLAFIEVFKNLNCFSRKIAKRVCKKWLDHILDAYHEVLVLDFCLISPKCPPWSYFVGSDSIFEHIEVGRGVVVDGDPEEEFWIAVGKYTKRVDITWREFPRGLKKDFLIHFPELEELEVPDLVTLFCLEVPPSVTKVHLKEIPAVLSESDKLKLDNLNLKVLTTEKISRLHSFCIKRGFKIFPFGEKMHEVLEHLGPICIPSHLNLITLEELLPEHVLRVRNNLQIDRVYDKFVNFEGQPLKKIVGDCFKNHQKVEVIKSLKEINLTCINGEVPCDLCVQGWIEAYPNLKRLTLTGLIKHIPGILSAFKDVITEAGITIFHGLYLPDELLVMNVPALKALEINCPSAPLLLSCSSMKSLHKLSLTVHTLYKDTLKELIAKTPEVLEFDLKVNVFLESPIECFQMIENGWPYLKKLNLEINGTRIKEIDFIHCIQGNFKQLRWLFYSFNGPFTAQEINDNEEALLKPRMEIFRKIPTLRRSHPMTYTWFCVEEYEVEDDYFFEVALR